MEGGIFFIALFFLPKQERVIHQRFKLIVLGWCNTQRVRECLISESQRPDVNIPPHCCKWLNLRVNMHPIIS